MKLELLIVEYTLASVLREVVYVSSILERGNIYEWDMSIYDLFSNSHSLYALYVVWLTYIFQIWHILPSFPKDLSTYCSYRYQEKSSCVGHGVSKVGERKG